MGKLLLSFNPHWSILDANVEQGRFLGHGDVYFPTKDLDDFLVALQAYPLQRATLTMTSPGLVNILVSPADGVGHLIVQIEVANEIEASNFARVRLRTDYSRLSRLASQLSLLAKGR